MLLHQTFQETESKILKVENLELQNDILEEIVTEINRFLPRLINDIYSQVMKLR